MYTIGQVSEMFHLPISTLRYYDKEGLFPHLERTSGIRRFSQREIDALHLIECLKRAGVELKDIRQFMAWCAEGPSTYQKRRDFFEQQKAAAEKEIQKMERVLDMLRFKCWYYDQAIADGNEDRIYSMMPDQLPPEIQKIYDHAHEDDNDETTDTSPVLSQ